MPTLHLSMCFLYPGWDQEHVCRWGISKLTVVWAKWNNYIWYSNLAVNLKRLILWSCSVSVCLTTLGLWRSNHWRMDLPSRIGWDTFALYCVHLYRHRLTALMSSQFPEDYQFCCPRKKFRKYQTNIYISNISSWA